MLTEQDLARVPRVVREQADAQEKEAQRRREAQQARAEDDAKANTGEEPAGDDAGGDAGAQGGETNPTEKPDIKPDATPDGNAGEAPDGDGGAALTTAEAPIGDETARLKAENERLRQAMTVLEGKYAAEVPRYAEKVSKLKARITDLKDDVERLTGELATAKEAVPVRKEPPKSRKERYNLTDDEEAMGDEWLNVAEKIARAQTAELQGQVEEMRKALARTQTKPPDKERRDDVTHAEDEEFETDGGAVESVAAGKADREAQARSRQEFATKLKARVPDFEAINGTVAWKRWLMGKNGGGVIRQDELEKAAEGGDAEWVAAIFEEFKAGESQRKAALAKQALPGRSGGSSAPAGEKQTYTMQQWQDAMNKIARDQTSERPEVKEAAIKLKHELELAEREGRIKQG